MIPAERKANELISQFNTELCFSIELSRSAAMVLVDQILVEATNPKSFINIEYWCNVQKFLKN